MVCRSGVAADRHRLSAIAPPTVAPSGPSIGSHCRHRPSAALTSSSVAPASTVAVRSASACASTRFRPRVLIITSIGCGGRPHASLVPPPRNTTDNRSRDAHASSAANSSAVPGSTTRLGFTPSTMSAVFPERAIAPARIGDCRRVSIEAAIRTVRPGRLFRPDARGRGPGLRRTAAASGKPCQGCRDAAGRWRPGRLPSRRACRR